MEQKEIDMTKTAQAKSDQLNAIDLIGGPKTITISRVVEVNDEKQPINIVYEGGDAGRPWKPCLGMRRAMIQLWGKKGHEYVGKKVVLWNNPIVIYGGREAGGIEILKASGIDQAIKVKLVITRGKNREIIINPIVEKPKAALTDEAFEGFSADLLKAKTMADLAAIGKEIKAKNFDAEGAAKLLAVYSKEQTRVRNPTETKEEA